MSGWEPVEATRYEYDDDGRLSGSVTQREAEWSRTDVEALIAYIDLHRVGPHGQPMGEATSQDGNPSNRERKWDYVAEPWTDFAARALAKAKHEFKQSYGDDAPVEEIIWQVKRVDR